MILPSAMFIAAKSGSPARQPPCYGLCQVARVSLLVGVVGSVGGGGEVVGFPATAAKRSAEPCSPRAPAAVSGGGLGAEPPSDRFVLGWRQFQGAFGQERFLFVSSEGGFCSNGQSAIRRRLAHEGAYIMTCSCRGRGTIALNLFIGVFTPKGGGGREPFQSVVKLFRYFVTLLVRWLGAVHGCSHWWLFLSGAGRRGADLRRSHPQAQFRGLDAPRGDAPEIHG